MPSDFSSNFNSSLRAGAMIQGIYQMGEARQWKREEREVNEIARRAEALYKDAGTRNPSEMGPEHQGELSSIFGEIPPQQREGGAWATFKGLIGLPNGKTGMMMESRHPDGSITTGPATVNGTTEDDDEVIGVDTLDGTLAAYQEKVNSRYRYIASKSAEATAVRNAGQDQMKVRGAVATHLREKDKLDQAPTEPTPSATAHTAPTDTVQAAPKLNLEAALQIPQPPAETATPAAAGSPRAAPVEAAAVAGPNGAAAVGTFTPAEGGKPFIGQQYVEGIRSEATKVGLDPELAMAVSYHESAGGDPSARSPTGARGLFQITDQGAVEDVNKKYGTNYTIEEMANDPQKNYEVGVRYLKMMVDKFPGNTEQALMAYNSGAGAVNRSLKEGGKPVRQEGIDYPAKVMQHLSGGAQAPSAEPEDLSRGTIDRSGGPAPQYPAASPEQEVDRPENVNEQHRNLGGVDASSMGQVDRSKRKPTGRNKNAQKAAELRQKREEEKQAKANKDPKVWEDRIKGAKKAYATDEEIKKIEQDRDRWLGKEDAGKPSIDQVEDAKVQKELAKVAPPSGTEPEQKEQADAAIQTVQDIIPAKKVTEKHKEAIITMARLGIIDLDTAEKAMKTGRITAAVKGKWQKLDSSEMVYLREDGTASTPSYMTQANEDRALQKANTQATKDQQAISAAEGAHTDAVTKRIDKAFSHLTFDDPDAAAGIRKLTVNTFNNLGINPDALGTMEMAETAARNQAVAVDQSGPTWNPYTWGEDTLESRDLGYGWTVANAPDNKYNTTSRDVDTLEKAYDWHKENYADPFEAKLVGADGQALNLTAGQKTNGLYVVTHLVKQGYSRESAMNFVATGMKSPMMASRNAGDMIKAIKDKRKK